MDQTPRLRSAFPTTPYTNRRSGRFDGSPKEKRTSLPLPDIPTVKPPTSQPPSPPLIPEHVLDAPTQRLFVVSFMVALWTWRLYDWSMLNESEEQSLWLFMKWVAIDGVFLFGLPGLRIPWMEWSGSTMMMLFCFHAVVDGMLMFRISPPLGAGLAAIGRSIWGIYEMAINEHNVNPETVLFNDSLILGRQIIHILPEGSATLNPERHAYCIDSVRTDARLPITINSTNPISMELLRTDLDTNANETISISKAQIKNMHKEASRLSTYSEKENEPKTLYYSVKKPGLYVLSKVIDESNLEVARKKLAHTVVVPCPKAAVVPSSSDRCRNDLSEVKLEIVGTPPLTVKYRKRVNQQSQGATYENIMPEEFVSPLARRDQNALITPILVNTAWAKTQKIVVPLSESLATAGTWVYSIEGVRDGFGNNVSYSTHDQQRLLAKSSHLHQNITVHERPTVYLQGCTTQRPLKVAQGQSANLPVQYGSTGRGELVNTGYRMNYMFSPQSDISDAGDHTAVPKRGTWSMKNSKEQPQIKSAGLYTITDVSTEFCQGDVLEPASCILQNPPQPSLNLSHQEIFDKCAGSSIGLRVDLDLIGTPPFDISYRITHDRHHQNEHEKISGLRGQIELTPKQAGDYTYEFLEISDAVYKRQPIQGLKLKQTVKPSASAHFINARQKKISCIDDAVSFDVALTGEGPFNVEYELIHGGSRKKYNLENVNSGRAQITTVPLTDGGDYTLTLASVTDGAGCKEFLQDEASINVRHQKPRVGFRSIDGRRSVNRLEGSRVQLPLRLEGDGPFAVKYKDTGGLEHTIQVPHANDIINVADAGTYELTDVRDGTCPGTVDDAARDFEISWIARPELRIPPGDILERKGNVLVKADICEHEEDSVQLLFKGSAPYHVQYEQHIKPLHGAMAPKPRELRSPNNVASLRMDTNQAGTYEYKLNQLKDSNYDHSSKHFTPLIIHQKVNPRPSAAFHNPGKIYSFCSVETDGEEVIPIDLYGEPPFDLEVEIKHLGTKHPEIVSLTGITSRKHNIHIPRSRLQLGKSNVSLRRVSDSKGCKRVLDSDTPRVQIAVNEAPTITPLEAQNDFCVGDRINFGLSGAAPFNVFYKFENADRKAVVQSTTFRRLAEKPGTFTITGVSDSNSQCKSATNITKVIHGMPSAQISKGREGYVDIHEGGEAEIQFDFGGVPPFEFTYTRSSNTEKNAKKIGVLLDMHSETSETHSMRIRAHEEGTYEVISIKDRYCSYTKPGVKLNQKEGQKRLKN